MIYIHSMRYRSASFLCFLCYIVTLCEWFVNIVLSTDVHWIGSIGINNTFATYTVAHRQLSPQLMLCSPATSTPNWPLSWWPQWPQDCFRREIKNPSDILMCADLSADSAGHFTWDALSENSRDTWHHDEWTQRASVLYIICPLPWMILFPSLFIPSSFGSFKCFQNVVFFSRNHTSSNFHYTQSWLELPVSLSASPL